MQAVPGPHARLSIVLAVGVLLYREGLAAALEAQDRLHVEGAVATMADAETAVAALQPDVLVLDASLPDVGGAIAAIRRAVPGCRVLVLAVPEDIGAIIGVAEAGADGFVTADATIPDLVEAIERTAAGELLCSPRIAAQLMRRAARLDRSPEPAGGPTLTIREQQVFSLLKSGLANKEIASALGIAEATVKNHVHHVLEKLQVTSRGQAAASTRFHSTVVVR
jgi:two-component system, NarL family, nitrate/nitrite response regulator NarL